jgi:putative tryptophan/tyrosine transport system substrate-binding protein
MTIDLSRRKFIVAFGGAAVAWPFAASAQQTPMPIIGFISSLSPEAAHDFVAAFHRGLNELGYIEGQNARVEYRWGEGQYDRLSALADELVRRRVTVIFATGSAPALAVKAATSTIPLVFHVSADPVELNIVASFNQPGGNATGISTLTSGLEAKRLEVLHELMPNARKIVVLVNPKFPSVGRELRDVQQGAQTLGIELRLLNASGDGDFATAFETLTHEHAAPLLVTSDAFFIDRRTQIVELAAHHAVPAIYSIREFPIAGGLMSYGTSLTDGYHRAGIYVGRILRGERPTDLPVEQSAKVELVLNMKTAKSLRLSFPISLLGRADEVIE